jgi:protein phosphatase
MVPPVSPGDEPVVDELPPPLDEPEEAAPVAPAEPEPEPAPVAPPPAPAPIVCHVCGWTRVGDAAVCPDCGYHFTPADLAAGNGAAPAPANPGLPKGRLQGRFEAQALIGERGGVKRYRGLDHAEEGRPVPVVILQQELPQIAVALPVEEEAPPPPDAAEGDNGEEEFLPDFDAGLLAVAPVTAPLERPLWPSVAWEAGLLRGLEHPGLPAVLAAFVEDGCEYAVEEVPEGRSIWDVWDDPEGSAEQRFEALALVAEAMNALHAGGAMLECIRPDMLVVTPGGQARITDLADLLPLPLQPDMPLRGSLYTAPELIANNGTATARAGLYSFGGLLYSLHVGRELSEADFDRPGNPKPFIPRWPDVHPGWARLLTKTFRREPDSRFPTDEAVKEDPSGFTELAKVLRALGRTYDTARLEIGCWTTTGIVRTGNEDAYAVLHGSESRQDDVGDAALILLCDGMGGYEAGEVAAALTLIELRKYLLAQPMFAALTGLSHFPTDPLASMNRPEGHAAPPLDVEECKKVLKAALKHANKVVYQASRAPGSKRRGMGCTAEAVYVDGRNVVVGHVGDSRTYHFLERENKLVQLTRDQTFVNRMVELGTITEEEAENHPRKNELQQAIGGQPDVEPGIYAGKVKAGDWVLVCSDGVTNHVNNKSLKEMLQMEAGSAETAARRLVNLTLIEGATDNATVVVVRAT